jgi:hypothetical protein
METLYLKQCAPHFYPDICRRASVRAAHREVRGYSTVGVKFPRVTRLFSFPGFMKLLVGVRNNYFAIMQNDPFA